MKIFRIALAMVFFYSLQAFAEEKKPYKVAVLQYMQETCTFCPGGDTQIADRSRRVPFVAGEELIKSGGFIGGFVHTAEQFGDMVVVGLNSPGFLNQTLSTLRRLPSGKPVCDFSVPLDERPVSINNTAKCP